MTILNQRDCLGVDSLHFALNKATSKNKKTFGISPRDRCARVLKKNTVAAVGSCCRLSRAKLDIPGFGHCTTAYSARSYWLQLGLRRSWQFCSWVNVVMNCMSTLIPFSQGIAPLLIATARRGPITQANGTASQIHQVPRVQHHNLFL